MVKKPQVQKEIEEDEESSSPFQQDILYTEDPKWRGEKYFTLLGEDDRILHVNFSKFFGKESKEYEDFITSCVSKKAYHKMQHLFAHTANAVLSANKEVAQTFLYKYYCVKRNIDDGDVENNVSAFVNSVVNLFDVGMVNEIRKYVNKSYADTGDLDYHKNKSNFIPEITFLDYHIKVLYVVSRMIHFVVPLCLEYLRAFRDTDTKSFLAQTFTALFPIAEAVDPTMYVQYTKEGDEKVDVYQKLYGFVERKVKDTLNSDATMWDRQAFLGVNWKTTVNAILEKLIIDILPEYSFRGNCMHMNVAVVRKSIQDYTLRKKDPFNINCLADVDASSQSDDNAVVTEAEQFDSYNAKNDELTLALRHIFAEDTVEKILVRKGIVIDPELYDYYLGSVKFHEFQTFAIFSAFYRYFGGTENIYGSINQSLYVKLMLAVTTMMNNAGLNALSNYVLGTKDRHYVSKKESRVSHNIIVQDPLYNHIVATKYRNVKNIIDKRNNFIESKISYLINNEFHYNCPDKELNGKVIPRNEDEIRTNVLQFYNTFIF